MKGGSFKGKTRRISSYIKPTMKKTKKSKPRNTSGGKSNKPPVYNPARGTYRTRLKKEEETDRYAKYYNKKMEPQEDYTEKFSGMRIDDSRNYHEKRTEYI